MEMKVIDSPGALSSQLLPLDNGPKSNYSFIFKGDGIHARKVYKVFSSWEDNLVGKCYIHCQFVGHR